MDEVFKKLESIDTQESSRAVSRLQKRLGSAREPQLLGELVDYYIASGSKQALKVLSSLKDVQSQVRRCFGWEALVARAGSQSYCALYSSFCISTSTIWQVDSHVLM